VIEQITGSRMKIFVIFFFLFFSNQLGEFVVAQDVENQDNDTEIWIPTPGTTWQLQFTGSIDESYDVQMYDIDMFDTSIATIDSLHSQGRTVICYISAGSWEDWRPDADQFPESVKGNSNGWPGEKWLDIRDIATLGPIMEARMDLCVQKGFDGIDPDNVDAYSNNSGFPLTYQDQLNYNKWLAEKAHDRGLSIGLKNDLAQIRDLVDDFDWTLNEQCFVYKECDMLLPFIINGKAVFQVEYKEDGKTIEEFCPESLHNNFSGILKNLNLDAWQKSCVKVSQEIPSWVKLNAGSWSKGQIDESKFILGIKFMINERLLTSQHTQPNLESKIIPHWFRYNAGWFADGLISDSEYVSGIQYLISKGILVI